MPTTTDPTPKAEPKGKKRSSVRHTRAIQRDRTKRPASAPSAEAVVARLTEIVHPATLAPVGYFHGLGLRARLLTLPVRAGLVLTAINLRLTGEVGSMITEKNNVIHSPPHPRRGILKLMAVGVSPGAAVAAIGELERAGAGGPDRSGVVWAPPLRDLTPQALAQRVRTLPAELFARVLQTILPVLQRRWQERQRPLPSAVAWAQAHFTAVLSADGSTLDGLLPARSGGCRMP